LKKLQIPESKNIQIVKIFRTTLKKKIFEAVYALFGRIAPNTSRNILLFIATLGIIGWAVYTQYMIDRLQRFSHATTETYAQLISEAFYDKMGTQVEYIILDQIIQDFDMPIIITDMMGRPKVWKNITKGKLFWKKKISQEDYRYETMQYLIAETENLRKNYSPRIIYGRDKRAGMGFLYYGNSNFISGLTFLPYLEVFFIISFVAIVYLILRAFLVAEQSSLWVGLAKETAHQLGTPLTSLTGWIEYIQTECKNCDETDDNFLFEEYDNKDDFSKQIYQISQDMSRDVARIKKVTDRFSYIGSKPLLERKNLKTILDEHIAYFSKRLPKSETKRIDIEYDCLEKLPAFVNGDLISWVLENLFKNSLDALDTDFGVISLRAVHIKSDKIIRITHRDNGRGIPKEQRTSVFSPGFTTKTRGWGLGLTLAKRIIEEYHGGKIFISWSQISKGTEFVIELPAALDADAKKRKKGEKNAS
jgi:signal transduction histidine kinase